MTEKILAILASVALFGVIGTIAYQEIYTENVIVGVQLKVGEDPFSVIKSIVPADSTLIEVKELDRAKNMYEVTVATKRHRHKLLEWMRKNRQVEKVE
jgi:hypothetical protein